MKKGAVLINTARGELIDQSIVLQALESGQLGGLALDVYTKEPPDVHNPLFALDQVVTTPHCGAHTDDAINAMGRMALNNCLIALRGGKPNHIINPEGWNSEN